jgi:hypothetical protein
LARNRAVIGGTALKSEARRNLSRTIPIANTVGNGLSLAVTQAIAVTIALCAFADVNGTTAREYRAGVKAGLKRIAGRSPIRAGWSSPIGCWGRAFTNADVFAGRFPALGALFAVVVAEAAEGAIGEDLICAVLARVAGFGLLIGKVSAGREPLIIGAAIAGSAGSERK